MQAIRTHHSARGSGPWAAVLWVAALLNQAGASPIVSREFIFHKAPFLSCHASTIVESQGKLLAAWFGGTHERHADVGIWLAHREGDGWTKPVEVANGVQSPTLRYPTWNPVLFQPKSGPLMLFYKAGPNPSEWWGMLMTSTDSGHTWSPPRRLPDGILGPIKDKPVQLPNGDILAGSSTEDDGDRIHFERTSDLGQSWHATPPLNGREVSAIQPTILIHRDGRLQALGRTGSNYIFQIWSNDGGKTWGKMEPTSLPNPNSGIDAVTLADDRGLLVYNHTIQDQGEEDRSPLNVAVTDDGEHWQAAAVLDDDPHSEFSYPAVIQTADGLVHITYTWRRERIRHVVLDPARLKPVPIVDGAWPASVVREPHDGRNK